MAAATQCSRSVAAAGVWCAAVRQGYDVAYEEFDGGHTIPPAVVRESLEWFLSPRDGSPG